MKIAVLYSGQLRCPVIALPTQTKMIAGWKSDVDAFALTSHGDSLAVRSYLHRLPGDVYVIEARDPVMPERHRGHCLGEGARNVEGCLQQMYGQNLLWHAVPDPYAYDLIVRMRYDLEITRPVPLYDLHPHKLTLPKFSNFGVTPMGGYNDAFASGPPRIMEHYFCRWQHLDECLADCGMFHMETILKWAMDRVDAQVHRSDIVFNKLYADGHRGPPHYEARYGDTEPEP